ncbi:MAG: hypothetical protein JST00_11065 [Deltaproteobacteria bacterium]|nr:hypothetical protein [Deltaproteobacteria bacterium]
MIPSFLSRLRLEASHLRRTRLLGLVASLTIAAIAGSACGTSGVATGATCPPNSTLTYTSFGQAFMQRYCTECHAGKERPDLDSLVNIRANIADIDRTSASGPNGTNTSMPEDKDVAATERAKLGEWLACGAP